jgi:uncharacterized protein YxjI
LLLKAFKELNEFYIQQSVGFGNTYTYYSNQKKVLAMAKVNKNVSKTIMNRIFQMIGLHSFSSHHYYLCDDKETPVYKLERETGFSKKFQLKALDGTVLFTYDDKMNMSHPQVIIEDSVGDKIASLKGDMFGDRVDIIDIDDKVQMTITKKGFPSSMKELFTTGGGYTVSINRHVSDEWKIAFIAFATIYDLLFFSKK